MAGQAPAASPIDFERSTLYMNELKIFEHPKFGNHPDDCGERKDDVLRC